MIKKLEKELNDNSNTGNIPFTKVILQIIPGGYGENDILLGIKNPILNKLAKKYYNNLSYEEISYLLNSNIHEYRFVAALMLTHLYKKKEKETFEFYLENKIHLNNWDIIDTSCYKIIGHYLFNYYSDNEIYDFLVDLYKSDNFWYRRIAIISTIYLIKNDKFLVVLEFFKIVTKEKHPINHKALGWMLREIGKKDINKLTTFLENNKVSNVTFSYATEKYSKEDKKLIKRLL